MNKINYQILSSFLFASLGFQIKSLSFTINSESIVFYRCLIGTIILIIIIVFNFKFNKKNFLITTNMPIQFFRALFGTLAMFFGYSSLTLIPLAQASTLGFTKVFFVSALGFFFLKEKLKTSTFLVSLLGFLGVYIIIDPNEFNSLKGTLLALISALFVALGIISSTFLSKKNNTLTILFYHSLYATILSLIFFFRNINLLNVSQLLWLILITITAITAQYFNVESYRHAVANKVVLLGYTRIIFSVIIGFLFLDEVLSYYNMLGIFIVAISTIFVSRKAQTTMGTGKD